jgi:predicted DNA-binding transcriptional regulator YafY
MSRQSPLLRQWILLKTLCARRRGVFHSDGNVHVVVRFSPAIARYMRVSRWHSSQKKTPKPNGGLLAEFDLAGMEEIMRWILGFGQYAVALEPKNLRRGYCKKCRH